MSGDAPSERRQTGIRLSRADEVAARVYRVLLYLYPREFRERFGDALLDFVRDRARARRGGSAGGRGRDGFGLAAGWARAFADLTLSAALERWESAARKRRDARDAERGRDTHAAPDHFTRKEEMLPTLMQDVRYALRGLAKRPMFAAVVIATLTLGIGANVAIFSVVNGILLRPLPYRDVGGIVQLSHQEPFTSVSEPEFVDYRDGATRLSRVAAFADAPVTLTSGAEPERVRVTRVSDGFFPILGVAPAIGRTFVPEEDRRHGAPRRAVVLSHGLWQRRFGGDSSVVGSEVRVNGTSMTIVGVMPERFAYPSPETAMWTPLRLNYDTLWTRNNHYLRMIGRLAPGATAAAASAELNTMARRFVRDYPAVYNPDRPLVATVTPLRDEVLGRTRPYLLALLGAVGFVLLIACVNVANLLLARGEARRKELAIRTALGASRGRIARQVLTESALHAALGGALALAFAWWAVRALRALAPPTIPRLDEVAIDGTVLGFALAVSVITGVLFGMLPAMRGARADSLRTLREGGKTSSQPGIGRVRGTLVVAEVALAVVMLTGAGLMLRSLWRLQAIDLGIRSERVLTMVVSYPEGLRALNDRAAASRATIAFYRELTDRVESLPGVRSAAVVGELPVADGNAIWSILIDGAPMTSVSEAPSAMPQQVTPGYFRTMGIPVVKGRGFTADDRENAPLVAVVNETMARALWPGRSAIGGTIKMLNPDAPWATVVGVVRDVRSRGYQDEIPPTMYFPHAQAAWSVYVSPATMTLVVKTEGDASALAAPVRGVVRKLEPNAPISRVATMERLVAASTASRRFSTMLLTGFAALALVLAAIGIYGVIAYEASQRTYEIGLRMALGARRGQVVGHMVRRGGRLVALGLAIGTAAALAITRLLDSMLVEVSSVDPATFAGVIVLLGGVALAATYLPARRATGVDPMIALRRE